MKSFPRHHTVCGAAAKPSSGAWLLRRASSVEAGIYGLLELSRLSGTRGGKRHFAVGTACRAVLRYGMESGGVVASDAARMAWLPAYAHGSNEYRRKPYRRGFYNGCR